MAALAAARRQPLDQVPYDDVRAELSAQGHDLGPAS